MMPTITVWAMWYCDDAGYRQTEVSFFRHLPGGLGPYAIVLEVTVIPDGEEHVWTAVPRNNRLGCEMRRCELLPSVEEYRRRAALKKLSPDERKALGL